MLGLSFSAVSFAASHDDTDEVLGMGEIDVLHDQTIRFFELRLNARYGITDAFSAELVLPLRVINAGIVYRDIASGEPVTLADPDIHHRDELHGGLFDPWLLGGHTWRRGRLRVGAKLGTTLPLGRTEENPFRLGDMGIEHEHIQFGSGIFAPIAGLDVRYDSSSWSASAQALTIQSLYESAKEYEPGDRYIVGLSLLSALGTDRWSFRAGATFQAETAERWGGQIRTDEGNQGRIDVLAGIEVSRRLNRRFIGHIGVQVPLYNHVVGGQLDYPAIAQVGLTGSFDLFGGDAHDHDHEHEHDHENEHDHDHDGEHQGHGDDRESSGADPDQAKLWDGVDMVELTRTGEAVPLNPVAKTVTVFDFWAPWCKPCKELDRRLAALARKYPGKLAIRKINIVDWDSEATAVYLTPGRFNLPHVKVFDATGARVFERSGAPAAIAAKIEELLSGRP